MMTANRRIELLCLIIPRHNDTQSNSVVRLHNSENCLHIQQHQRDYLHLNTCTSKLHAEELRAHIIISRSTCNKK